MKVIILIGTLLAVTLNTQAQSGNDREHLDAVLVTETWIEDLWDMYTDFTGPRRGFSARKPAMIREASTDLFFQRAGVFFRDVGRMNK